MPTNPSSFQKQPYEEFTIEVKFDKQLASDETITDHTATITSEGTDLTSTMKAGSKVEGHSVLIGVKGGTSGESYKITTKITTDASLPDATYAKYESDVIMVVVEE